jgi:hypothetical protein
MTEQIPPTPLSLKEALELASELLADIELNRAPLASAALKASRLARLLNDFDAQEVFKHEASGYPSTPTGVPPDIWRLAGLSGRTFQQEDPKSKETNTFAYLESVEQLEAQIEAAKLGLQAAQDRNVSIASANPAQYLWTPTGNFLERRGLHQQITQATQRLSSRRALIYDYVSRRYCELKFSGMAQDVFSTVRETVDREVGSVVPAAVQKFNAVHDNLRSDNPEDWSNAVHSCRRILQDLADELFPPQSESRFVKDGETEREIKLGRDHYINRLMCFVSDNSSSSRFEDIVGSHLRFLGDRLEAIFKAAQKGSHASVGREEANRYVVYTYMIVGDILTLRREKEQKSI